MAQLTFQSLPENIILNVISYLPQQDKVNLLYTNYHFYVLVQQKLYQKLIFSKSSALECAHSFEQTNYTIIGGLKTPLATDDLNRVIRQTKQDILLESISVNQDLCKYIEEIVIVGDNNNDGKFDITKDIVGNELLDYMYENCQNIKQVLTYNLPIPNVILPSLNKLQLNSFKNFERMINNNVDMLDLDFVDNSYTLDSFTDDQIITLFGNLKSLTFNDEISQTLVMKRIGKIDRFRFENIQDLKIIFYHNFDSPYHTVTSFLKLIDFTKLRSLELVLGCNDITCDCLHHFTNYLVDRKIKVQKIAFVQKTMHRDHNYTEAFDMHIAEFIKKYPNLDVLKELSILHTPPSDFNIGFGFEGNYLHRKTLFESVLPLLKNLEMFNCPSFFQSIACYEQLISDMLWNGCKCEHCEDYLPLFDNYIMNHKYYDEMKSRLTDMISPIIFGNAASVLSHRVDSTRLIEYTRFPLLSRFWDFHTAPYQITHLSECQIDKSAFPPIAKCISHFLLEYANSIGEHIPTLKKCVLSGIVFHNINNQWISSET